MGFASRGSVLVAVAHGEDRDIAVDAVAMERKRDREGLSVNMSQDYVERLKK